MIDLGKRLKLVRKNFGFTQKQVADGLQISEQAYQRYEYGKVVPSAIVLIDLADFYGISLDYLVGRFDTPERR